MTISQMLLEDSLKALNVSDNFKVRNGLMSYDLAQCIQDYLTDTPVCDLCEEALQYNQHSDGVCAKCHDGINELLA